MSNKTYFLNDSISNSRSLNAKGFGVQDYISIVICTIGMLSNALNIYIFLNRSLTDRSYKYMMVKSAVNFSYLLISLLNEFFIYCVKCPVTYTFFANIYAYVIGFYLCSSLALLRILIELTISFRIYQILKNKIWLNNVSYKLVVLILLVISVIYYSEKPFTYTVQSVYIPLTDQNLYFLVYSEFGLSKSYTFLSIGLEMIRMSLSVIVLTIINCFSVFHFRKRFQVRKFLIASRRITDPTNSMNSAIHKPSINKGHRDAKITPIEHTEGFGSINTPTTYSIASELNVTKNITQMVISSSFLRILGDLPLLFAVVFISVSSSSLGSDVFFAVAGILLFLSPSFDFIVYYLFNKHYRNILNGLLKRIFRRF